MIRVIRYVGLITAFLILRNSALCQKNNDFDSLRKYSYPILGFVRQGKGVSPTGGTCFFIRKKGKIFLITAKHGVNGCEDSIKGNNAPREMTIFLHDSACKFTAAVIIINVSKIVDTSNCLLYIYQPDIIAIEVNDPNASKIYSVEKFILPPFKKTDNIEIFGFPGNGYYKYPSAFVVDTASNIRIRRQGTSFHITDFFKTKRTDSSNLLIINKSLLGDSLLFGYSGSPVFLKELNSNRFRLIGAESRWGLGPMDVNTAYLGVTDIKYAFKEMEK